MELKVNIMADKKIIPMKIIGNPYW